MDKTKECAKVRHMLPLIKGQTDVKHSTAETLNSVTGNIIMSKICTLFYLAHVKKRSFLTSCMFWFVFLNASSHLCFRFPPPSVSAFSTIYMQYEQKSCCSFCLVPFLLLVHSSTYFQIFPFNYYFFFRDRLFCMALGFFLVFLFKPEKEMLFFGTLLSQWEFRTANIQRVALPNLN